MNKIQTWQEVLDGLTHRYKERVPDVKGILEAMKQEELLQNEDEIENDHIAFRTMGVAHLGVASLEKIFLHYGYVKRDYYFFPEKKLNAWWYAPPAEFLPRIFISELRVEDLSDKARTIIHSYTNTVTADPVDSLDLDNPAETIRFLHSPLWHTPSLDDYKQLAAESEYAAWVIFNRYYLNHYTLSVHQLKKGYNTVAGFNDFLEKHGFRLNNSGGKIKQSPDGLLIQSSTVAGQVEAEFARGEKMLIPGSYVEFAERRVLPAFQHLQPNEITRSHRREGFEAGNADKIFESTYTAQAKQLL
ncbi:DUF1338 domain-containing protein [Filimonas effusa]|uniref:2-oxoadipate dioxygenase/decarboxylase n=1 Tax=Filimonas effusa TaxID=2508721 RepID=A0A4Q1D9I4_9BACT|nr:DUF1338 domain-containing protein [Filimonas effusa]RXK86044.1 DUF1338 domain-containing protein [Filimonas effusa]